ncbi:calcium-binding protein [Synechococcus sp. MU1648]|uniref:calcium-binding protein n=1 Tax=Synechococcus sp. MU1648 TaxID=2508351 RepID=UPI002026277B|nr:calcium-binding protein [Synechococcus sp. MU1648]
MSDDLKNAGLTEQDITITTDGNGIGYLSFSIDGQKYTTTVIGISEQSDLEVEEESDYDLVVNGSDSDDVSHGNNYAYPSGHEDKFSEGTETWTTGDTSDPEKFEPENKDQAEKIDGKGGNDYIFANKGNDYIEGGAGNDTLYGNSGSDEVLGGPGNDKVNGNNDDDTIRGGLGDDTLNGGDGNDRLVSDQDNDQLYGNDGDDTLLGGDGNDILNGGDGDDEMFGDNTSGEEGNDIFKASPGNDTIKDFYYGKDSLKESTDYAWDTGSITTNSATNSAIINVLSKTSGEVEGTTTVIFKDEDNYNTFLEILNNSRFPPIGASDPDTKLIHQSDGKDFEAIGGKEDNIITVEEINEFANYYYDDSERYTTKVKSKPETATTEDSYSIDGKQGNDTITGGDKNDYLHGNVGDDKLDGGLGNDRLLGGSDNDTIEGGKGNDSLFGWSGKDSLEGGNGNDYLKAEDGADTLDGGEGNDTLDGGEGNDTLNGGVGNDSLIGGDGSDRLRGLGGDDTLKGGAGKDAFFASTDEDLIEDFKFGEDSLKDSTYFIWDRDNARFDDEEKQVSIDVRKKDENVKAGTTIIKVENYDELIAYIEERNQIVFPPSGASDPDTKLTFKGKINDSNKFEITGGDLGNSIDLDSINDFTEYYLDDDEKYINESSIDKPFLINQTDVLTIKGGGGRDSIQGGDANDDIHGGQQNDTIEGGEGNDTLRGGNHNDSLIGGEGDDLLRGENAADTLDGGLGDDILYGAGNNKSGDNNKWADVFIASPGNDEIKDFVFGVHELRDSDSYFWELKNTIFNDDEKTATIPVLDESGYEVGQTIILVENYEELIKAKEEDSKNAGFPPLGANDENTKVIYKGSDDGVDQFEALGGSEDNTINLESINEFAEYYILDDARYEDQSSLRNGKPTTINDDDHLIMDGGRGNDSLTGDNGNDTIEGGDDDDILIGGDGNDSLKGGEGKDRIDGGYGDDTMKGGTGGDIFYASQGIDLIEDFTFTIDKLKNSVGITWDVENATYDDENESVIIKTIGSPDEDTGTTTIKVANYAELIAAKEEENALPGLPIDGGNNSSSGDNGSSKDDSDGDLIDAPGSNNNGNGDDNSAIEDNDAEDGTIEGQPINPPNNSEDPTNQLREVFVDLSPSKSSFDKIKHHSKRIFGADKNDKLHGKDKNDFLNGRSGNDYLYGQKGNDTIIGEKGDDLLQGGFGNDSLKGGLGDDVLYGGEGNDKLTGNGGKDIFVLSAGRDIITDFNIQKDAIGLVYALDLTFTQNGDDLQISGNDGVNTLLRNVDKDDFLANFPDNLFDAAAVEVSLI